MFLFYAKIILDILLRQSNLYTLDQYSSSAIFSPQVGKHDRRIPVQFDMTTFLWEKIDNLLSTSSKSSTHYLNDIRRFERLSFV
jgi:hypothetical protein